MTAEIQHIAEDLPVTVGGRLEGLAPQLARDLAQDLFTLEEIVERHGLDRETVDRLRSSKTFVAMVETARNEWNAPGNTKSRAQLKAQLAVEMSIGDLYKLVADAAEPAGARVAAFGQLKEVGRFEKAPPDDAVRGGGAMFSVNINLGDRSLTLEARPDRDAPEQVDDGEI